MDPRVTQWQRRTRITAFAILCISGYLMAMVMWNMPQRIGQYWGATPTEPQSTWGALRIANGRPLYTDYRTERPSVPLVYGVLNYMVPGWLTRCAFDAPVPEQINWLGRITAAGGFLATLALLMLICRQRKIPPWLPWLPLAWFPFVSEWSGKFFPDFPALAFSLLGWWVLGPPGQRSRKSAAARGAVACAAWLIAFHFKPIVLAGPLAAGAELLWQARAGNGNRPLRELAALAAGLIIAVLITSAELHRATNGLWTLNLVTSAALTPWTYTEILLILNLVQESRFLVLVPLAAALTLKQSPLALAMLLNWLLATALMFKMGANVNYYAGTLAVAGVWVAKTAPGIWNQTNLRHLKLTCISLLILLAYLLQRVPEAPRLFREQPPISRDLAREAYLIFRDNRTLSLSPYLALNYNLPFPYLDGFHAMILEQAGQVDFSDTAADLANRRYQMLVVDPVSAAHMPLSMRRAIDGHYAFSQRVGPFGILIPK